MDSRGVEMGVDVFGSSRKWAESLACWGFSLSSEGRGAVSASICKSSLGVKGLIIGLLVTLPSLQVDGLFVSGMGWSLIFKGLIMTLGDKGLITKFNVSSVSASTQEISQLISNAVAVSLFIIDFEC